MKSLISGEEKTLKSTVHSVRKPMEMQAENPTVSRIRLTFLLP